MTAVWTSAYDNGVKSSKKSSPFPSILYSCVTIKEEKYTQAADRESISKGKTISLLKYVIVFSFLIEDSI